MCSGIVTFYVLDDLYTSWPGHGYYSFFLLPSVVEIPRAKTKLKTRTMLERLHFVLGGCVG